MVVGRIPNNFKGNHGRVHHLFACFCEIHGDQITDARLHLARTPFGVGRTTNEHAGFQDMMRHRLSPPFSTPDADQPPSVDLPALIAARICHDLISPLGAIGNGVELLEMVQSPASPELALVRDSVQQAHARIRLFRIAFGPVRSDQRIGAEELCGILRDYRSQNRFDLAWSPTQSHAKPMVKLAFLALLCMETALPYGGQVFCDLSDGGLRLLARSDRLMLEPDVWEALGDGDRWPDGLRAAHVQFPLLRAEAMRQGATLVITRSDDQVDLRITAATPLDSVSLV